MPHTARVKAAKEVYNHHCRIASIGAKIDATQDKSNVPDEAWIEFASAITARNTALCNFVMAGTQEE
jgi:hypothetical protein